VLERRVRDFDGFYNSLGSQSNTTNQQELQRSQLISPWRSPCST